MTEPTPTAAPGTPRRAIRSFVKRGGRITVGPGTSARAALAALRRRFRRRAPRPRGPVRAACALHGRDRLRRRRDAGRARDRPPGAGLPRPRGACAGRRPLPAARRRRQPEQPAGPAARRGRGARAARSPPRRSTRCWSTSRIRGRRSATTSDAWCRRRSSRCWPAALRLAAACAWPPTGRRTPTGCARCWTRAPSSATLPPARGYVPRPAERPTTKFERRGTRLGHEPRDLEYLRL